MRIRTAPYTHLPALQVSEAALLPAAMTQEAFMSIDTPTKSGLPAPALPQSGSMAGRAVLNAARGSQPKQGNAWQRDAKEKRPSLIPDIRTLYTLEEMPPR